MYILWVRAGLPEPTLQELKRCFKNEKQPEEARRLVLLISMAQGKEVDPKFIDYRQRFQRLVVLSFWRMGSVLRGFGVAMYFQVVRSDSYKEKIVSFSFNRVCLKNDLFECLYGFVGRPTKDDSAIEFLYQRSFPIIIHILIF